MDFVKSRTFDRFPGLWDTSFIYGTIPNNPGRMACMVTSMAYFLLSPSDTSCPTKLSTSCFLLFRFNALPLPPGRL
ncbi:hypothetical protein DPMN_076446 [Dreissena polymorpha]|uniref:Uncharacterized protein n=1 Tax=Dreissena polymorpha TaxID=45954 RepID=A0A9D3YNP0_DREPO|nr:hypothetical protein DPMN_076446 [Dreissena polymorpha]